MGWIGSGHKNGPIDNSEVGTSIRSLHLDHRETERCTFIDRLHVQSALHPCSLRLVSSCSFYVLFSRICQLVYNMRAMVLFLFCSRPRSDGWPHHGLYFLHLSLSSAILIDSSTGRRAMVYIIRLLQQCYDRFVGLIFEYFVSGMHH